MRVDYTPCWLCSLMLFCTASLLYFKGISHRIVMLLSKMSPIINQAQQKSSPKINHVFGKFSSRLLVGRGGEFCELGSMLFSPKSHSKPVKGDRIRKSSPCFSTAAPAVINRSIKIEGFLIKSRTNSRFLWPCDSKFI